MGICLMIRVPTLCNFRKYKLCWLWFLVSLVILLNHNFLRIFTDFPGNKILHHDINFIVYISDLTL